MEKLIAEVEKLEQRQAELVHNIAAEREGLKNREAALRVVTEKINAELERAAIAGEKPNRVLIRELKDQREEIGEDPADVHARLDVLKRAFNATTAGLEQARHELKVAYISQLKTKVEKFRPEFFKALDGFLGGVAELQRLSAEHGDTPIPMAWLFGASPDGVMSPREENVWKLLARAYPLAAEKKVVTA